MLVPPLLLDDVAPPPLLDELLPLLLDPDPLLDELDDPGTHTPPAQLPPGHAAPSALTALAEQAPVAGSQVPASWQSSLAGHCTGLVPTQIPLRQWSTVVHLLPSSHGVPLGSAG